MRSDPRPSCTSRGPCVTVRRPCCTRAVAPPPGDRRPARSGSLAPMPCGYGSPLPWTSRRNASSLALSGRPLSRSSSSRDSPPTFWRCRAIATCARAIDATHVLERLEVDRRALGVAAQQLGDPRLVALDDVVERGRERQPLDLRASGGGSSRSTPWVLLVTRNAPWTSLTSSITRRWRGIQLHELQHRQHDAARVQVIGARADHAAGVDEQPQERPVLRVDPGQRQVLDVGDPVVAAALERGARPIVELEVGLGERRRRHARELVRLAVHGVEPGAQGRAAEPARPSHAERDRDDEPEPHHEEEHFHGGILPRGGQRGCGRSATSSYLAPGATSRRRSHLRTERNGSGSARTCSATAALTSTSSKYCRLILPNPGTPCLSSSSRSVNATNASLRSPDA